jgi:hypothetical protein
MDYRREYMEWDVFPINALSLYLAERAGRKVDPMTVPLIREYPVPKSSLLPFTEHGKRFSQAEWETYHV